MTTFLIVLGALVLGGIGGGLLAWRPLSNDLATARAERRAAQKRCANLQAQRDRLAHDGVALRALAADFYASWAEADADADVWWMEYAKASDMAHDYAIQLSAAQAHEAVLVEPTGALPLLRDVPGVKTDYQPQDFDAWWAALDVGAKALPAGSVAA